MFVKTSLLQRLIQQIGGTASVELALLSPLLLIMVTGLVEVGVAVIEATQVQVAAQAGALYAAKYGTGDLSKISAAITNATSTAGITASPSPTVYCGCASASGVTSQGANCATVCADGKLPGTYVSVSATISHTGLLSSPYLSLSLPASFVGTSVIRIQ